jgi:hypothetical protein
VLALLVSGRSDREIARTLYICHRTASNHVSAILRKLNVATRTEAAVRAVRAVIIQPPPEPSKKSPSPIAMEEGLGRGPLAAYPSAAIASSTGCASAVKVAATSSKTDCA